MGFLKNFLGGFAEGYIEERGIEGTVEDLGSLAKGVKNFFSDDSQSEFNEEVWDNLIDRIDNLVDNGKYDEAENILIDYYNQYENGEPDYWYFRYRCMISICYYENLAYDNEQNSEIEKEIREFLKGMKSLSGDDKDNLTAYQDMKDCFENKKKEKNEMGVYMARWEKTLNRINDLIDKQEYGLAQTTLDDYYSRYEPEKDFLYYDKKCDILVFTFLDQIELDKKEGLDKAKKISKEFALCINEMRKIEKEDDRERREMQEGELNFINDTIKRQISTNLTDDKKFDEARAYIESSFLEKGNVYYQQLSRIESLRLMDAITKKLPVKTVRTILDDAKFNMNLAIELEEDDDIKKKIKENVLPRIEAGESYIASGKNDSSSISQSVVVNSTNSAEQEYIDEYKACIEDDGIITDRERRLLDKLRKSLGISEERAAELEAQSNPSVLSADEMEYIEEFKACMADGSISERERRLLDRLAKSLNISPERVAQIEKSWH